MLETINKNYCKYSITDKIVEDYIRNTCSNLRSYKEPLCIINVGGPASGKSTVSKIYITETLNKNIDDFCIINPDIILEKYFSNDINCYEVKNNSPYFVVNKLFIHAIKQRYNILYDTTGINIKDIKQKMKLLYQNEYKINIVMFLIDDLSIALDRIKKRFKKSKRDIDRDYLYDRYQSLPKVLNNFYFKLPKEKYNQMIIFNTSTYTPKITFNSQNC